MFRAPTAGLNTHCPASADSAGRGSPSTSRRGSTSPPTQKRCFPVAPDSKGDGSTRYPTPMATGAPVTQCSPLAIDSRALSCEPSQVSRDVTKARATKSESRFGLVLGGGGGAYQQCWARSWLCTQDHSWQCLGDRTWCLGLSLGWPPVSSPLCCIQPSHSSMDGELALHGGSPAQSWHWYCLVKWPLSNAPTALPGHEVVLWQKGQGSVSRWLSHSERVRGPGQWLIRCTDLHHTPHLSRAQTSLSKQRQLW